MSTTPNPFADAIALLTRFIDQEQELRGENDKGYDYTTEQAFGALQVIQDTVRGATIIANIAGQTLASNERRIRELLLSNSMLKDVADKRRDRLQEIAEKTEFADLEVHSSDLAETIRTTHKLAADPIKLLSGQIAT